MNENETTFVAPEGVYSVTEEYKPAPAHLHPVNNTAPAHATKLSTITVRFQATKQGNAPGFAQLLGGNRETRKENKGQDGNSLSSSDTPDDGFPSPEITGQDNVPTNEVPSLFSPAAAVGKKKAVSRPKHNIRTTSSTFISRLQSAEGLAKAMQTKQGDVTFLFYNSSKSFLWVEVGSKSKEPLARVTFTAYPTCHDVNPTTASSDRLDVVIGFNTGDLVWFDPMSSRYSRLNKQGCISNSPCTSIRWVPTSATLFLVSHADGTIIIYDKEREDGVFIPQYPKPPMASPPLESGSPSTSQDTSSATEWNPLDNMLVTAPPWHPGTGGAGNGGKPDREKTAKNPVSHWRVSRRSLVDFIFSPDVKYVAAISEDGCLRLIDAIAEQLVDCYASYFGALTCVAWSPDGRFILTGGQDDLLTIFSPWEQRVVARCQGHSSFVSSVAFDEVRCDGRTYRFGSVGEDNKLILWDFSSGALHRPKHATHHQRFSMASTVSLAYRRGSLLHLPSVGSLDASIPPLPRYHPAPSRNEVSVLQPVLIKHVDCDIMTAISFLSRALLTASKTGLVKMWVRPLTLKQRMKHKEVI